MQHLNKKGIQQQAKLVLLWTYIVLSRHCPFTMIQLIKFGVIMAWQLTGCFYPLTSSPQNWERITHVTGHGSSEFKQHIATNVLWQVVHQTNDYEQVWLELKCARSASQPKQQVAVRTLSKTCSITQRAKLHSLPKLPELLYVLLAVNNISTLHTADKWSFETKLQSRTTGRRSQASRVCFAKVAAPSITCIIFHLMDKTLCMGQYLGSLFFNMFRTWKSLNVDQLF